jgi:hypothetical protein
MADEIQDNVAEAAVETAPPPTQTDATVSGILGSMVFENSVPPPTEIAVETDEATITTETETKPEEEILDESSYLKNKFGWDSEEVALNEIKTLREKAEKNFEYKNEDSKKLAEYINEGKIDDLYQFLDTQKRIDRLSKADLSDKNIAAELVKFGLQKDNPNLDPNDIEFLFNEKYSLPEKPQQSELETDDEYAQKVSVWQAQVNTMERRLVIEAKMQQPKMAQLKSELVLPKIEQTNQQQQPQTSQEDLDAFKKLQDSFVESAKKTVDGFNGFNVQVKDKDVDYTVSFTPSPEARVTINSKLQQFASAGFDANAILADRWVMEDGKTLNTNQMIKDLSRIYEGENAEKKIALDSKNKALETYLKGKKQVTIGTKNPQGTFTPTATNEMDALREAMLKI